ncbi:MAG: hypothetical protein PUP92_25510 [Rhizonema sp. PD38]|nr:hypothetical protein [Rhizonema sp. PD38]
MLTEQNKVIALEFYKAFDNRNIELASMLLSPNFVAHIAGVPQPLNANGFKQFGMAFYLAFTNGQHILKKSLLKAIK